MRWNICCLVGVLVLVPACGGSSGGGGSGSGSGTLAITEANAEAIARLVIGGAGNADEINEMLNAVLDQADFDDLGRNPCPGGGFITVALDDVPPEGPSTGDTITITFEDCEIDLGDGPQKINGEISVKVVTSSSSTLAIDFSIDNVTVTVGGETSTIDGDMRIELTDPSGDVVTVTVSGNKLSVSTNGSTNSLENYRTKETLDRSSDEFRLTMSGTVRSDGEVDGTVTYETTEDLVGVSPGNPSSGQLRIKGASGSVLLLTVIDDETVRGDLDADGDGEFEASEVVSWDDLQN